MVAKFKKTFKRLLKVFLKVENSKKKVKSGLFKEVKADVLIPVELIRVVDGDTFKFAYQNQQFRARLLIVDTPESVEGKPQMPFGKEAAEYALKRLTQAKRIEIAFDRAERQDRYQRYLVYLYLDGKLFQSELLRKGLAIVRYIEHDNQRFLNQLLKAQRDAQQNRRGVWQIKNYVFRQKGHSFNYNIDIKDTR